MATTAMSERSTITAQHIADFERDGFVLMRGAFAPAWVQLVRDGIEQDLRALGPLHTIQQEKDARGYFVTDFCMSQRIRAFRSFVLESDAGEIAASLMRSTRSNFFYDAMWAKGPGTRKRTRWHQDQPYYPIDGRQVCILWMPVDPVSAENSLECIRGSRLEPLVSAGIVARCSESVRRRQSHVRAHARYRNSPPGLRHRVL